VQTKQDEQYDGKPLVPSAQPFCYRRIHECEKWAVKGLRRALRCTTERFIASPKKVEVFAAIVNTMPIEAERILSIMHMRKCNIDSPDHCAPEAKHIELVHVLPGDSSCPK